MNFVRQNNEHQDDMLSASSPSPSSSSSSFARYLRRYERRQSITKKTRTFPTTAIALSRLPISFTAHQARRSDQVRPMRRRRRRRRRLMVKKTSECDDDDNSNNERIRKTFVSSSSSSSSLSTTTMVIEMDKFDAPLPKLSTKQGVFLISKSLLVTVLASFVISIISNDERQKQKNLQQLVQVIVIFTCSLVAQILILNESRESERLVDNARDENSRFSSIDGVNVHHKFFAKSASVTKGDGEELLFSCAHGFGANVSTFENLGFVDALLNKCTNKNVSIVCHDSVGFGLTERPLKDLQKYTKTFNAKCLKVLAKEYAGSSKTKVVYVGHSLGSVAAALAANDSNDNENNSVAAVVLIAPAFIVNKKKKKVDEEGTTTTETETKKPPPLKKKIVKEDDEFYDEELFNRVCLSSLKAISGWFKSFAFNLIAKPILFIVLRSIVRSKQFWRNGLQNVVAKSKKNLVNDSWIDCYRRPRAVRNWDKGMINFVAASLNDGFGMDLKQIYKRNMRIYADKAKEFDISMNPMDAIEASCLKNNVPVLIVHGREDKVVPLSNSENIFARLIMRQEEKSDTNTNVKLVIMENCGHCPHEEDPDAFVQIVSDFLKT